MSDETPSTGVTAFDKLTGSFVRSIASDARTGSRSARAASYSRGERAEGRPHAAQIWMPIPTRSPRLTSVLDRVRCVWAAVSGVSPSAFAAPWPPGRPSVPPRRRLPAARIAMIPEPPGIVSRPFARTLSIFRAFITARSCRVGDVAWVRPRRPE